MPNLTNVAIVTVLSSTAIIIIALMGAQSEHIGELTSPDEVHVSSEEVEDLGDITIEEDVVEVSMFEEALEALADPDAVLEEQGDIIEYDLPNPDDYPRGSWEWLVADEARFYINKGLTPPTRTENTPYNQFSSYPETIWGTDLANKMVAYPRQSTLDYSYKKLHITGIVNSTRSDGVMVGGTFLPGVYGTRGETINAYCYGAFAPATDGWGTMAVGKDCAR